MAVELDRKDTIVMHDSAGFLPPISSTRILYPKGFEEAYSKFGARYNGTELYSLFDGLLSPFSREVLALNPDDVHIKAVSHDSPLGKQASSIVNFAYNSRYVNNGGSVVDIATDERDFLGSTNIIVAEATVGDESVVLATFRVVSGEDLDVFDLFDMSESYTWPHKNQSDFVSGELGRFSLHPVFDLPGDRDDKTFRRDAGEFKRQLLRDMWPHGMELMRQNGVTHPYFILAPHVRNFVDSVGIHPVEIPGVEPSNSEYSQRIRMRFKEYWNPYGEVSEQPRVFLAPWKVVE